jgi:hypothetical protein
VDSRATRLTLRFPIIDKGPFIERYNDTKAALLQGKPSGDSRFLCVLFAVYAFTAGLTYRSFRDSEDFELTSPSKPR